MKKNWFAAIAVTFLTVLLTACTSQVLPSKTFGVPTMDYPQYKQQVVEGATWTIPMGVDFLPVGHPLSEQEARLMKLHRDTLKTGGYYYNELRLRHTFEAKYLEAGTSGWFDENGNLRYLVSCGNQTSLIPLAKVCPSTVSCPLGKFSFGDNSHTTVTPKPLQTEADSASGSLKNFLLSWLGLPFLIAFWLIALAALAWLARALYRLFSQSNTPEPPTPIPTPTTPAPAPTPIPTSPVPAPTPVAPATSQEIPSSTMTVRQYGPFMKSTVSDRQADGFHVSADGKEIGVFSTPVNIEDAGERGHFVVHTTTATS
jgi:hypothetical protein